jgi:hypothetical protein
LIQSSGKFDQKKEELMSKKNDKLNDLRQEQLVLMEKQFKATAKQLGWDLNSLEKLGLSHQKELKDMQDRMSKAFHENMPDPQEALKILIPNARNFSRSRNIVFYKPDPFGPGDRQTNGPFRDVNVPPATGRVCVPRLFNFLDTIANHGTNIQYTDPIYPIDDPSNDPTVSESSSFNPKPGVNSAHFRFSATGKGMIYPQNLDYAVSFWFNFIPPEDGEYIVRPTASLLGTVHGSTSSLFAQNTFLQISFRTSVYQDPAAPTNHDVVLFTRSDTPYDVPFRYYTPSSGVIASESRDPNRDPQSLIPAAFARQTPSNGVIASVSVNLNKDLQTYIGVSCIATVRIRGYGSIYINAHEPYFGLRVPEVHVEMLDCSQSISLEELWGWREERRESLPDPRDWLGPSREHANE